jgi:type I restriction enzyme R subunit
MAKPQLKQMNGHFVESDYENALISFLERKGWPYLFGDSMSRANRKEVLNMEDLLQFLKVNHEDVKDEELQRIADNVRLVGADTVFATLLTDMM